MCIRDRNTSEGVGKLNIKHNLAQSLVIMDLSRLGVRKRVAQSKSGTCQLISGCRNVGSGFRDVNMWSHHVQVDGIWGEL